MAPLDEVPSAHGLGECAALVRSAEALRLSAPELAVQLVRRALVVGAAESAEAGAAEAVDQARSLAMRAQAVLAAGLVRISHHVDAVEPALSALALAESTGDDELATSVRLDLAACAREIGEPLLGCALLRPVLESKGLRPSVRAVALGRLVGCVAHVGRRDDVEDALAEADRLLGADDGLNADLRRLERVRLSVRAATYHRWYGDTEDAVDAAREGLGQLNRLRGRGPETARLRAQLVLELACALLDEGDPAEAETVSAVLLEEPVRATSAAAMGHLMLAVATRIQLPSGRVERGRALLDQAARIGDRHGLDGLLADALTAVSQLDEQAGRLADALESTRGARSAEQRRLRATARAARQLLVAAGAARDWAAPAASALLSKVITQHTPPAATVRSITPDPTQTDNTTALLDRDGLYRRLHAVRNGERPVALALVRLAENGTRTGVDLTDLAGRLRDLAPDNAELARSDGTELAVILPRTTKDQAEAFAKTVRDTALRADWLAQANARSISTGVGQSNPDAPSVDAGALLTSARYALTPPEPPRRPGERTQPIPAKPRPPTSRTADTWTPDTRTADARAWSADARVADGQATATRAAATRAVDTRTAAGTGDAVAGDARTADVGAADGRAADARAGEGRAGEGRAGEGRAADTWSADARAVDAEAAETWTTARAVDSRTAAAPPAEAVSPEAVSPEPESPEILPADALSELRDLGDTLRIGRAIIDSLAIPEGSGGKRRAATGTYPVVPGPPTTTTSTSPPTTPSGQPPPEDTPPPDAVTTAGEYSVHGSSGDAPLPDDDAPPPPGAPEAAPTPSQASRPVGETGGYWPVVTFPATADSTTPPPTQPKAAHGSTYEQTRAELARMMSALEAGSSPDPGDAPNESAGGSGPQTTSPPQPDNPPSHSASPAPAPSGLNTAVDGRWSFAPIAETHTPTANARNGTVLPGKPTQSIPTPPDPAEVPEPPRRPEVPEPDQPAPIPAPPPDPGPVPPEEPDPATQPRSGTESRRDRRAERSGDSSIIAGLLADALVAYQETQDEDERRADHGDGRLAEQPGRRRSDQPFEDRPSPGRPVEQPDNRTADDSEQRAEVPDNWWTDHLAAESGERPADLSAGGVGRSRVEESEWRVDLSAAESGRSRVGRSVGESVDRRVDVLAEGVGRSRVDQTAGEWVDRRADVSAEDAERSRVNQTAGESLERWSDLSAGVSSQPWAERLAGEPHQTWVPNSADRPGASRSERATEGGSFEQHDEPSAGESGRSQDERPAGELGEWRAGASGEHSAGGADRSQPEAPASERRDSLSADGANPDWAEQAPEGSGRRRHQAPVDTSDVARSDPTAAGEDRGESSLDPRTGGAPDEGFGAFDRLFDWRYQSPSSGRHRSPE